MGTVLHLYLPFTASHRGGSGPPLVCLHGFTGTWRTSQLVLPLLERHREVLAPTLLGHAGGPPLEGEFHGELIADSVECAMDEAGFETAHIAGNSLGSSSAGMCVHRGALPRRLAPARRLGRARRRRALPAAGHPARGGAADPRIHQ